MKEESVSNEPDLVSNQETRQHDDVVKYETHSKLLGQHKRTKEELTTLRDELEGFRRAESERQESLLAEQGKYKEALELKTQKIQELQETVSSKDEREAAIWKHQAFYNKLPGKLRDVEFLSHAKIDNIIYDADTMSCDAESVEGVVNDFMEKYPFLVEGVSKGKLPSEAPNSNVNIVNKINKPNAGSKDGMRNAIASLLNGN